MADRKKRGLATPPWVIGPGLLVPPLFLPMVFVSLPVEVAPSLPLPHLDADAASRHLDAVDRRRSNEEPSERGRLVLARWSTLQKVQLENRRDDRESEERAAEAQALFRESCRAMWRQGGAEKLLALGDSIAVELARAASRLTTRPRDSIRTATLMGGGFLLSARASGLIDDEGRLRVHPIVPFALSQMAFRLSCGLQPEVALQPIELDGVDAFRIRFGQHLPAEVRLASIDRFAKRYPTYPSTRARARVLLDQGRPREAFNALAAEADRSPRSLALRNHLLHVRSLLE